MRLNLALVAFICSHFLANVAQAQSCGSVTYTCSGVMSASSSFDLIQDATPAVSGLRKTCHGFGQFTAAQNSRSGVVSIVVGKGFNEPGYHRICFAWGLAFLSDISEVISGSFQTNGCFLIKNGDSFEITPGGRAGYLDCFLSVRL